MPRGTSAQLDELLPEGHVARGQQRIFAGIPAQEMGRLGVSRMMRAACPDLMKKKLAGVLERMMQIVLQTPLLPSGGREQSADFRFKQQMLPFLRAQ